MDWVGGPACPEGLLHPVLPAANPADKLNAVQDDSQAEFLPQRKFELCQVGDDLAQKLRILEFSDMRLHVATGHGHIPCHRGDDVQCVFAELSDNPVELLHRELDGSLGRHHQGPVPVVAVVLLDTL